MYQIMKSMKNLILINNKVLHFSTIACLNVDKKSEKLKELQEEKEALQYDLDSIGLAVKAASKITSGETPSIEENETLSELQENYSVFFDSEGEQEGASSLLNKIMGVKRYLSKEINTNKTAINSLKGKTKIQESSAKESEPEQKDLGKQSIIEKGESSKRKAEDISDSKESIAGSSKKSRQISDDIVDDIPYNPFDDLGSD